MNFILKLSRAVFPSLGLLIVLVALFYFVLKSDFNIVSNIFLIAAPVIFGFIAAWFAPDFRKLRLLKSMLWLWALVIITLCLSFVSGLAGMICVAMAAVPLLLAAVIGLLIQLSIERYKTQKTDALRVSLLPMLIFVVLAIPPSGARYFEIEHSVIIDAHPEAVFALLQNIREISEDEVPTRLVHLFGIPKPTAAIWEETETGAIRHAHWTDKVHFIERITSMKINEEIQWEFEFPEGWIETGIEDPNLKIGDGRFDVVSGGYFLEPVHGGTKLILKTVTYDNSGLRFYAKFWHKVVFTNLHETCLNVVKNRLEKARGQI